MATEQSFVDNILDQAGLGDRLAYRKMFGEYGLYLDGKMVALACDDTFFLKPTDALAAHGLDLPTRPPYPGARPHPVADELLDDPSALRQFLLDTADRLPTPKPKSPKKKSKTAAQPKATIKRKSAKR